MRRALHVHDIVLHRVQNRQNLLALLRADTVLVERRKNVVETATNSWSLMFMPVPIVGYSVAGARLSGPDGIQPAAAQDDHQCDSLHLAR